MPPLIRHRQHHLVLAYSLLRSLSNLHAPDLRKPHVHEGHSYNMCVWPSVRVIISTYALDSVYGWTGFDPIASLFIVILIAASQCHTTGHRYGKKYFVLT
jgi:Co/Zn/Cd efflux system component